MNQQNNDPYHELLRATLNWNHQQTNNQNTNTTTTNKTGKFIDSNLSGGQNFGSNSNSNFGSNSNVNFGTFSGDLNYASGGTFTNKQTTNNNGGDDMTDDDSDSENGSNGNGVAAAQQDVGNVGNVDTDVNMDVGNQVENDEKERERFREGEAQCSNNELLGFTQQEFDGLLDQHAMANWGEGGLKNNLSNDNDECNVCVQDINVLKVDSNESGMVFKFSMFCCCV